MLIQTDLHQQIEVSGIQTTVHMLIKHEQHKKSWEAKGWKPKDFVQYVSNFIYESGELSALVWSTKLVHFKPDE